MPRRQGSRNKRTLLHEREREGLAAIDEARRKVLAAKGSLDPTIAIDSLAILEETMRHFYFAARSMEVAPGVNLEALDKLWEKVGRWAERVANFHHAKISAMKLVLDPTDKPLAGQTLEQLRHGILADLEKLADAGVIDLVALAARKRPKPLRHDALAAEHASLFVDDHAVDFEMAVEGDAWSRAAQHSVESGFTNLDRLAPQIFTLKLKQVESAEAHGSIMLAPADHLEYGKTLLVAGDCFAIQHARSGRHRGYRRYD